VPTCDQLQKLVVVLELLRQLQFDTQVKRRPPAARSKHASSFFSKSAADVVDCPLSSAVSGSTSCTWSQMLRREGRVQQRCLLSKMPQSAKPSPARTA
jgi:hypothetical protein